MTDTITTDAIFGGRLQLKQERDGYRFSIDAVLLGYYGSQLAPPGGRVLDVGCGVGVVGMVAATVRPDMEVVALDVQSNLTRLAEDNVRTAGLESRVTVVCDDIRQSSLRERIGEFSLALCNPPYYPVATGRLNPRSSKAAARHEVHGALGEIVEGIARLLESRGWLRFIYPAESLVRALDTVDRVGLKPVGITPIHSLPGEPARLVFVDGAMSGRREMKLHPPVVIFSSPGEYTPTIAGVLAGELPTSS